jgi:hypothetical protein
MRTPLDIDRALFQACFSKITVTALRLARDNYILTEKPLKPCTNVYSTTTGLPCAHKIEDIREQGLSLLPRDFHAHWHWDRYPPLSLPPVILEPLQVISYSQSQGLKRAVSSTRRLPSGFEATEERARQCGLCHQPGHTRASLRCPVNIRQVAEELNSTPIPASNLATESIPRSVVQSIVNSASQSALKSALQPILDSGVESIPKAAIQSILDSTLTPALVPLVTPALPVAPVLVAPASPVASFILVRALSPVAPALSPVAPALSPVLALPLDWDSDSDSQEPDPRPVWPGRIEVIYSNYIAEKTTWLTTHPAIRPVNYRKARGLKAYPRKVIQENRKSSLILKARLPKRRLNLNTKRLEKGPANWTDEEICALFDYEELESQRVEEQEEAAFRARGGFSAERGIWSLMRQIDRDIQAEKVANKDQYSFFQ